MIFSEERNQHGSATRADYSVRPGISGIGRGVTNFRQPIRVGQSFGIAVIGSSANGSYRPPEVIRVFGVVERDDVIRECYVQQGEEPSVLCGGQVMRHGRRLRDLVPIVLDGSVPEATGKGLV